MTTPTAGVLRPGTLSRGQVATLLVGIGLDLARHRAGDVFGPIHPAHVRVDVGGRPGLVSGVQPPPGWTPHDDWVSLLRFGRAMGRPDQSGELSWWSVGRREGTDLLRWLLEWATPEPLPVVPPWGVIPRFQSAGSEQIGRRSG